MLVKKNFKDLVDFSRGSTATGWVDGKLREFAIDEPRFVTDPATGYSGLLLEPAAQTNLLRWSGDLSNGVWGATGVIEGVPDSRGGQNAVTAAGGVSSSAFNQRTTSSSGGQHTITVVAKAVEGKSPVVRLALRNDSTATIFVTYIINLANGSSSGSVKPEKIEPMSNGFWKIVWTTRPEDLITSGDTLRIYLGWTAAIPQDFGITVDYAQLEAGTYASTFIPTGASQVTRAGDRFILPTDRFDYRPDRGTLLVDAMVMAKAYAGYLVTISETLTHTGGYQINMGWPDERNNTVLRTYITNGGDTTTTAELAPRLLAGNRVKLATSWDSSGFVTAARGEVTTQVVQPDGYPDVKNLILSAGAFSIVRRVLYYPERLPDAQLAALTELT